MTNAQELIEAVLYRMAEVRELDAEIVNFAGKPLVRNIHWKGERPGAPPGKRLKLALGCLMALALLFGTVHGYWGLQEQERHLVGSAPPHDVTLRALIENGPGTNRHVTVTDFRPGGYAFGSKAGSWTRVWVALFPAGPQPGERKDIRAVLSSTAVGDEAALRRLLQPGRVTGICSEAPKASWGTALGPRLLQVNPGCQLSSAWVIEELREPPSAARVTEILAVSAACFAAVLLLAVVVFWKAV
jgi:hypothetical protein